MPSPTVASWFLLEEPQCVRRASARAVRRAAIALSGSRAVSAARAAPSQRQERGHQPQERRGGGAAVGGAAAARLALRLGRRRVAHLDRDRTLASLAGGVADHP